MERLWSDWRESAARGSSGSSPNEKLWNIAASERVFWYASERSFVISRYKVSPVCLLDSHILSSKFLRR